MRSYLVFIWLYSVFQFGSFKLDEVELLASAHPYDLLCEFIMLLELTLKLCIHFLLKRLIDLITEVPLVQSLYKTIHTFTIFVASRKLSQEQRFFLFEPLVAIELLQLRVVYFGVFVRGQVDVKGEDFGGRF